MTERGSNVHSDILLLIWAIVNSAMGVTHYKLTERTGPTKTSYFILTIGVTIATVLLSFGLEYYGTAPEIIQPLCS